MKLIAILEELDKLDGPSRDVDTMIHDYAGLSGSPKQYTFRATTALSLLMPLSVNCRTHVVRALLNRKDKWHKNEDTDLLMKVLAYRVAVMLLDKGRDKPASRVLGNLITTNKKAFFTFAKLIADTNYSSTTEKDK